MRSQSDRRDRADVVTASLVLLLAVASCAGASAPTTRPTRIPIPQSQAPPTLAPTQPTTTPTKPPTDPPTPPITPSPTAPPTPTLPPDPFGVHETPPPGLESPLPFTVPFSPPCRRPLGDLGPGPWATTPGTLTIPGISRICLVAFSPGAPVNLVITAPDGTTISRELTTNDDGIAELMFRRVPGVFEGTYTVHAQQASLGAETSFEVAPAQFPKALAVPEILRAGKVIRVWFGGLTPGSHTPAYLWLSGSDFKWEYVAGLGDLVADEHGFGEIALSSQETDPPGVYLVVAGPRVSFRLDP